MNKTELQVLKQKALPKIEVSEKGCLLWRGYIDARSGYGKIYRPGTTNKYRRIHRVIYEIAKGPIAPGLTLDHLCRVRHCVNPNHLEAVTPGENVLRGLGPPAHNARKTHCKRGHEFTEENIYRTKTGRECFSCKRGYHRDRRAKAKKGEQA